MRLCRTKYHPQINRTEKTEGSPESFNDWQPQAQLTSKLVAGSLHTVTTSASEAKYFAVLWSILKIH